MVKAVCWGAGWDSTAMIIEMVRRDDRPAIITFADVGAEKNVPDPQRGEQVGTYDFIPIFTQWCRDNNCPEPQTCVYNPQPETLARYREATERVVASLGLKVPEVTIARLSRLYGNMVANDTLPGIAFGPKSCSIKYKLEAQEPI